MRWTLLDVLLLIVKFTQQCELCNTIISLSVNRDLWKKMHILYIKFTYGKDLSEYRVLEKAEDFDPKYTTKQMFDN